MTNRTKIYLAAAAAAVIITASLVPYFSANRRVTTAERELDRAAAAAEQAELKAAAADRQAAEYKQKLDYLESQLGEITQIARRQDNELKTLNTNSNNARRDLERARGVRAVDATAEELCGKLAELGHPCI